MENTETVQKITKYDWLLKHNALLNKGFQMTGELVDENHYEYISDTGLIDLQIHVDRDTSEITWNSINCSILGMDCVQNELSIYLIFDLIDLIERHH